MTQDDGPGLDHAAPQASPHPAGGATQETPPNSDAVPAQTEPPLGTEPPAPTEEPPARDAAWFEALTRTHARAIVRYFARRAPRDDAEDLAAEVLLTAWRRRADVPAEAELPWLYRTAGYVLANYRRKRTELLVAELPERPGAARVGTDPEVSALFDAELRGALAAVSPRDREIILLHAWEGLDGTQLAAVLGISRSGADAALSRARKRLREAWGDRLDL